MDTNWKVGRRSTTEPRLYQPDPDDPKVVRLRPRKPPVPTMDCGAGWYHAEAIAGATNVDSHRGL